MEYFNNLFGVDNNGLSINEIVVRTIIVFVFAVALVRIGQIRFLKKSSAFDAILYFMLGALMGDAITSSNNFYGILVAGLVLIFLHWILALLTYYSHGLGKIFKGKSYMLIKDGEILWDQMEKHKITEHDLQSSVRLSLNKSSFDGIKAAYLERNGDISFVKDDTKT